MSLNVALNLEYNRCNYSWRLFFNYKNFNKSLHYKTILSNQNKSLKYNCTQKDSEISCETLPFDTFVSIIQAKNVTKYNITVLAENEIILSFPFTFDQCHLLACENVISFAEIQRTQKLDDDELSVIYRMTQSGVLPPNISGYIETMDHSNGTKQIFHLDKSTLIQRNVSNEKKITVQNTCSDYQVCLVTSWQACINDTKVNKNLTYCKVIKRKESSSNVDAQCHLYPKEKRVEAIFMSSDITKVFELSVSGKRTRHVTNKSSISIALNTDDIKGISLTPCTKCSCSKKEKVRCIEDKVTRGNNPINIWYVVIAAAIIPVVVVVLLALFCKRQELIQKFRQRRQGETIGPREQVNEYTEILDKHSYIEVVVYEEVGGDIK